MEIRASRRALAWLVRDEVLLPGALVSLLIFGLLGAAVTPYDAAGNPMLLSPDILAADAYRDRAAGWAAALRALYLDLYALLESGGRDLYGDAAAVAEAVAVASSPPPAMAELYQDADATARACLEAARLSAAWASAPGAALRAAGVRGRRGT